MTALITGEMLLKLITDALEHGVYLNHKKLAPIVEDLLTHADVLRGALKGSESGPLAALKAQAGEDDSEHDRAHKLFYAFLKAVAEHGRTEAEKAAGRVVVDALYADGLVITTASYEREVAAAVTFQERLARADVHAALTAVAAYVPSIEALGAQVVVAAEALGTTLKKIRALEIDKAGKATQSALFEARRNALSEWSLFVHTVENVYRPENKDSAAAHEALVGPWRRLLASGAVVAKDEGTDETKTPTAPAVPATPVAGSGMNLPPPFVSDS